jgi:hypothetical protein
MWTRPRVRRASDRFRRDSRSGSPIGGRRPLTAINLRGFRIGQALGIPIDVRRSDVVSTVRQIIQEGRDKAYLVLLSSPIERVRDQRARADVVAALLFDFGPAIIMMMASAEARRSIQP